MLLSYQPTGEKGVYFLSIESGTFKDVSDQGNSSQVSSFNVFWSIPGHLWLSFALHLQRDISNINKNYWVGYLSHAAIQSTLIIV